MFIMRKYELLGVFVISLLSIAIMLLFWILPSNFLFNGIKPTSDSLWQISKLMFFAAFIYTIFEYYKFGREFHSFFFAKSASLFLAPILFIGLSYIMDTGMGFASLNNHIFAFALALVAGQYVSYFIMRDGIYFRLMNEYAIFGIILMLTFFISYGSYADKFDVPIFKPMNSYQTYIRLS